VVHSKSPWGLIFIEKNPVDNVTSVYANDQMSEHAVGAYFGDQIVGYDESKLTVHYLIKQKIAMNEAGLYEFRTLLSAISTELDRSQHGLNKATTELSSAYTSGKPVIIIAHATVCRTQ
jgi:hypothetical protein